MEVVAGAWRRWSPEDGGRHRRAWRRLSPQSMEEVVAGEHVAWSRGRQREGKEGGEGEGRKLKRSRRKKGKRKRRE
jgi:hypothetical protein